MDKYCRNCGAKLSDRQTGFFDPQTGKPVIKKICRNCNPCDHELKAPNIFQAIFAGVDAICIKCGKRFYGSTMDV
jgi:hypothetical protein